VEERTYAAAGVSLATADSVVERFRAAVESTGANLKNRAAEFERRYRGSVHQPRLEGGTGTPR